MRLAVISQQFRHLWVEIGSQNTGGGVLEEETQADGLPETSGTFCMLCVQRYSVPPYKRWGRSRSWHVTYRVPPLMG
jgi:hypothetical protein